MKRVLKNKKDLIIFLIIFVITLIIFIPFLKVHYSTDSYGIANVGYKAYIINNSLRDGRIIMSVIGYIAELTNISIDSSIIILTILALITSCISVLLLKNIILEYKKTNTNIIEIFVTIISYFTIFNFLFIENMLYVECFVMSLSILFYLMAAKILTNKNDKYYLIKTMIFVSLGILSYQGTISMFLISLLVFSLIKNKDYKLIIKDLILGGIITTFGICVQLLFIECSQRIFNIQQTRINDLKELQKNIIPILKNLPLILINTGFVYPKYLYIIFISIIELVIIIKAFKDKKLDYFLYNQLIIIFFSIMFAIAISFISTSGFWNARIRFSIGTTIGFLLLYLYYETDLLNNLKRRINLVILFIFAIYALSIIINYIGIMNNTLKVNDKDKKLAIEILQYVENYEKENRIKVDKLVIAKGKGDNKTYFKELKYKNSALSWSSMRTQWAIEGTLEMYTDKEFNLIKDINHENLKYFYENVDVNREYMCINDALYISYYVD